MKVLANAVQATDLTAIFAVTPPRRRIAVAAAFLGVSGWDILRAAGMSRSGSYEYNLTTRRYLPGKFMVELPKVLGVPFVAIWDDEALDTPALMIMDLRGVGARSDANEQIQRPCARAAGALRLAAG